MTFIAYLSLLMAVALIVFLFTGSKNKKPRDFMIITGLLLTNTFAAAILALHQLEVL